MTTPARDGAWLVAGALALYALAGCDNSSATSTLALKSCWTSERDPDQDEMIEQRIREFGESKNAEVLGAGVLVQIRHAEARYNVIYSRFIPAYGRMVRTFWSDDITKYPYAEWDEELRVSLSSLSSLSPCDDGYEAWMSG